MTADHPVRVGDPTPTFLVKHTPRTTGFAYRKRCSNSEMGRRFLLLPLRLLLLSSLSSSSSATGLPAKHFLGRDHKQAHKNICVTG